MVETDRALVRLADVQDHPLDTALGGPPLEVADEGAADASARPAVDDRDAELGGRDAPDHVAGGERLRHLDGRRAGHLAVHDRGDVFAGDAAAFDAAAEAD